MEGLPYESQKRWIRKKPNFHGIRHSWAKAGILISIPPLAGLDPGFLRGDTSKDFLRKHQKYLVSFSFFGLKAAT
jgi:hypothetical protein